MTSAPTVRTASRNSGRMNLRLSAVKPLWVFTVMTLSEAGKAVTPAEGEEGFTYLVVSRGVPPGCRSVPPPLPACAVRRQVPTGGPVPSPHRRDVRGPTVNSESGERAHVFVELTETRTS